MTKMIDIEAFKVWRRGMQEAEQAIEREKTEWLRQLTPEESMHIYLGLWELASHSPCQPERSEMLERVMTVFQRYLEAQRRDEPAH